MKPTRPVDDDALAETPFPGLSALRVRTPPPSMVPAVMRRIAEPQPVSFWAWLRRPRRLELRASPIGLAAAFAVAALILVAWSARTRQVPAPATVAAGTTVPAADVVMVRFVLVAKGAKHVGLAGDFNAWQPDAIKLENVDGQGTFVATVPLGRGAHEYMFLVDGEWVVDPSASEQRPDGFGRRNGVLRL